MIIILIDNIHFQGLTVRVEDGKLTVARILIDSIIDRQGNKYLLYWKYHLSFDDGEIFAGIA